MIASQCSSHVIVVRFFSTLFV